MPIPTPEIEQRIIDTLTRKHALMIACIVLSLVLSIATVCPIRTY